LLIPGEEERLSPRGDLFAVAVGAG